MKRIAVIAAVLCLMTGGVVAFCRILVECRTVTALAAPTERQLTQQEIRDRFAEIVKRISDPLITMKGEMVTDLEIGEAADPETGTITARIAAVHYLSCGCCESNVKDTKFFNDDLDLVLSVDNIGHLTVNRTCITDDGLKKLPRQTNITHLDLSENNLTDDALRFIGKLRHLKFLKLNRTAVSGSGLEYLSGLKELEELHLSHTPLKDSELRHLSSLVNLKKLVMICAPITGRGFADVKSLYRLEELNLSGTTCTDEGLANLPAFMALKQLNLDSTGAGDAALAAISRSLYLEQINLTRTEITDADLASLARMKQLRSLTMSNTKITDDGLAHLANVISLQQVCITHTGVRGPGVCHLEDCRQLQSFGWTYAPTQAIEADQTTLEILSTFKQLRQLNVRVVEKDAVVEFHDMHRLRDLQITCSDSVDSIRLSTMPDLNTLTIRYPGQKTFLWYGKAEPEGSEPDIRKIVVEDVGNDPNLPLKLSLVVPDELHLSGIPKVNRLWVTGSIQNKQAEALASLPPPYGTKIVCPAGTDPEAVARILSKPDAEEVYDLELTVEHWDRAWSDALRQVHNPCRRFTMRVQEMDDEAPIALGGFKNLDALILEDLTANQVTFEHVSSSTRELKLENVSVGELRMLECCMPVHCHQVNRFDRLVIDGIPLGEKYVHVFYTAGNTRGTVAAPTELHMHNVRDLFVCSLRCGRGLARLKVFGEANDFAEFQFVPDSLMEMTWEGKEPGRWQGEFERR